MRYLHEKAMLDAYQRLYMLGNRPYEPKKHSFEGIEAAASAGIKQGKLAQIRQKEAAAKALKEKQLKAENKAYGDNVWGEGMASVYGTPDEKERIAVMQGRALPVNPNAEALEQKRINDATEKARIGGRYTPQGLEMADKNANLNARDMMMQRALIGRGMRYSIPDVDEARVGR